MPAPFDFTEYIPFRSDPSNDHVSDGMWCGERATVADLQKWMSEHPSEMFAILEKRRARYAMHLIDVDKALFAKAKTGDKGSIELLWARFENWSPRIEESNAKQGHGKSKTLADLMGEL